MTGTSMRRALLWSGQVVVLAVGWFFFAGKLEWQEFSLGSVCAVLAALALNRAGAHNFAPLRPRARWFGHLLTLPYQVLRDSLAVISALLRRLAGRGAIAGQFSTGHFNAGGEDAVSTAKRAFAVGITSFPPNSIVIEISREEDTILYHELVPQGTMPEPAKTLGEE
jgi:multisubunit Na+/H+ antiporter MnhE subunit